MTTTTRARAGRKPKQVKLFTFADDLRDALLAQIEAQTGVQWPSSKYAQDPVLFFDEILGIKAWDRQVEVLESIRDHPRVAVRSGHKVSKSNTAAGVALWIYCSFPDARVVMTSTTARQVDEILWRELRMMLARHGQCVACKKRVLDGARIPKPCPHSALIHEIPGQLARTGLRSVDFREISGFTAREAEAVAGISGSCLWYIVDEASGVPRVIFEAIEGNRAGGARLLLLGNPTRNEGEFFDAFYSKAKFYKCLTISSEETPNVKQRRIVVPGLCELGWVEEKREEWGEDSAIYSVRVKGLHALNEQGKIFSIAAISASEDAHKQTRYEIAQASADVDDYLIARAVAGMFEAVLTIGVDPAGESGMGDDAAFSVRRGNHQIVKREILGLSEEGHAAVIEDLLSKHARPYDYADGRRPSVVVDREGKIGYDLYRALRSIAEQTERFDAIGVRASDGASREPLVYDRRRDELAANLVRWFRDGGEIIEDSKLETELHILTWEQIVKGGRLKVLGKREIKRKIGRSPDRYDALALSCWTAPPVRAGRSAESVQSPDPTKALDPYNRSTPRTLNAVQRSDVRPNGIIDPYRR